MSSGDKAPTASSSTNRYGGGGSGNAAPKASTSSANATASYNPLAGRPGGVKRVPSASTPSTGLSATAQGKRPAAAAPSPAAASSAARPNPPVNPGTGANPAVAGTGTGVVRRSALNAILINVCQKGNPVITNIRNVPWEYGDIKCDYQVGLTSGVLFLSLRYHLLHPEYIHTRIKKLGHAYALRIMLVNCDVENHQAAIRELTKTCLVNEYTMMVAWSTAEVARYLELYKQFERKPPDLIKQRTDDSYIAHLTQALTSVRGVNKTDVTTLASHFGSFAHIVQATPDELNSLPGLGDKKVKRLRDAFEGSFVVGGKKKQKVVQGQVMEKEIRRRGSGLDTGTGTEAVVEDMDAGRSGSEA